MDTIQEPSVKVAGSVPPARLVAGQDVWDLLDSALKLPFTENSQTWTQVGQDGSGLVFLQRECCRRSWLIVVFSSVQLIEGRIRCKREPFVSSGDWRVTWVSGFSLSWALGIAE